MNNTSTINFGPKAILNNLVLGFNANNSIGAIKTPRQIENLVCWIDFADSSSLNLSGSFVINANDKSGNGYTFVSPNSSSGIFPLYQSSSLNGLPGMQSQDNASVSLKRILWNTSLNLTSSDFTIFGVIKKTSDGSNNQRAIAGYANNWLMGFWSAYEDQFYYNIWIYGSGAGSPFNLIPSRVLGPKLYVAGGKSDNSVVLCKRNGLILRSGSAINDGPNGLVLGGYSSSLSEVSYTDFHEVIVYNRFLEPYEVTSVENYLSNKWNIPLIESSASLYIPNSTISTANSPTYIDGTFSLTDNMSYIDTNKKWTDITSFTQTSSLSICAWVRPLKKTIGGSYGSIVHSLQTLTVPNTSSRGGFHLRINENLTFSSEYGTNTFYHLQNSTNRLTIGKWHHLAMVRNQYSNSIYLDGQLEGTTTFSSGSWLDAPATNIVIGRGWSSNDFKFNGDIGLVDIYETPLTSDNIYYLYNQFKSKYNNKTEKSFVADGLVTYIDAANIGSYPGSGDVVYGLTGSQNFNFTSSGVITTEPKYFDCSSGTTGILKRSGSIEPNLGNEVTIIVWAKPISSTSNWRTMTRGYGADHHLIVQSGGHTLGFYESGTAAFLPGTGSDGNAYLITNISNYNNEYNSYEIVLSSTAPQWQLFLNGESSPRASITSSLISNNTHSIGTIGGFTSLVDNANPLTGSSQYFGNIGCALIYNRVLTNEERWQNYSYFRTRFNK